VQSAELVLALLIAVAALVTLAPRPRDRVPDPSRHRRSRAGPGAGRAADPDRAGFSFSSSSCRHSCTSRRSSRPSNGCTQSRHHRLPRDRPRHRDGVGAAVVAHALIPGLPWAVALALGAIVAPPDEIAATAIAARLAVLAES